MECAMDHIVLNMEDEETMLDFYTRVLELRSERLAEYRGGTVPFPSVRLNADTIIDLFPKAMWQRSVPPGPGGRHFNHLCLSLGKEDWDALHDRLVLSGVSIETGPAQRWGAHGTGTSIYFRDPEHNLIEARHYQGHDAKKRCLLGS
jgi:catechol 2,3-dioxygenase-like lactoylglutathione lyase family enzyme